MISYPTKNGRERRSVKPKPKSNYFTDDKPNLQFIPSGCTLLDCALGGGYCIGRISNIVGDKSTAKTALATEALINFVNKYPDGAAAYRDTEAAFDRNYAEAMGLPLTKIDFGEEELWTVEDFARDLDGFLDQQIKAKAPGIYVIDSLDALSDEVEMEAEFGKASYGMGKAKFLSTMLRKIAKKIEQSNVLVLIVSQVRENIGVTFGEKYRRAGGKALDHYCSQILWLAAVGALKRTIKKVERQYGVTIRAKVKKNKVGLAFRECDFDFVFGYGVEDLGASVQWLHKLGRISNQKELIESMTDEQYRLEQIAMSDRVKKVWAEIETTFLPTRRKYT